VAVPRVGVACEELVGVAGTVVPAIAIQGCVERVLRARLERVLRPTIRPNVVLIVTDDQPAWTMDTLSTVASAIAAEGTTFVEATPQAALCAPSRASILTGQYVNRHGVLGNLAPNNAVAFDDGSTVATWLHDAGYTTGLFGKYLNGYEVLSPYVPPGWDVWQAFAQPG